MKSKFELWKEELIVGIKAEQSGEQFPLAYTKNSLWEFIGLQSPNAGLRILRDNAKIRQGVHYIRKDDNLLYFSIKGLKVFIQEASVALFQKESLEYLIELENKFK